MKSKQAFHLAALAECPGLGSHRLRLLLEHYSKAETIWRLPAAELAQQVPMPRKLCEAVDAFRHEHPSRPAELFELCASRHIHLCTIEDELYPNILKEIFSPPVVLYYRGTLLPDALRIAMVGARRMSRYGEALALEFGRKLAEAGMTVVSGAARGIDTCAHRGVLDAEGRTVAVLGCGVDVAYPRENRRLLSAIAERGAVLSEYSPGTPPLPAFFPARNRIISGLAQGTLVVEAARRSGSLITAEQAVSEGRDVYAIPGSVCSPTSEGCHHLIQQGAKLVIRPADILEDCGFPPVATRRKNVRMTPEERQIYQDLSFDHALSMDEIILSLPAGELSNLSFMLLNMELKGLIVENELHAYRRAERE